MFADELPHDEATRLAQAYAPLRTFEQRMTSPGFRRMLDERDDAMAEVLFHRLSRPLPECRILDVGCGSGRVMRWLARYGAVPERMVGIELQPDRVAAARAAYPELIFIEGSGEALPFDRHSFDIVIAFTMFSSITDPIIAQRVAIEIQSVLDKGGVVLWYDMRYPNPANPNLRAMTMARIGRLFPGFTLELESLTLLPPLAERLGSLTDTLYPVLSMLPPLRSHYFGLLRASAEPSGAVRPSEAEYDYIDRHW